MKVDKSKRITPTFLTKYEKARVIGTRALQISRQAPVMVQLGPGKRFLFSDLRRGPRSDKNSGEGAARRAAAVCNKEVPPGWHLRGLGCERAGDRDFGLIDAPCTIYS